MPSRLGTAKTLNELKVPNQLFDKFRMCGNRLFYKPISYVANAVVVDIVLKDSCR